MQKRTAQQLGAIGFSALPWAIYHFFQWRWTTNGAHFQPSTNEHLVALWALSLGVVCSILSLALSMRKTRNGRATLFSIVLLASGAWYCAKTVPLITEGFRARWALGTLGQTTAQCGHTEAEPKLLFSLHTT